MTGGSKACVCGRIISANKRHCRECVLKSVEKALAEIKLPEDIDRPEWVELARPRFIRAAEDLNRLCWIDRLPKKGTL